MTPQWFMYIKTIHYWSCSFLHEEAMDGGAKSMSTGAEAAMDVSMLLAVNKTQLLSLKLA